MPLSGNASCLPESFTMKPHLLAAVTLAALGGIVHAQSSGSDTATPAIPNARAPADAFTSPAVPGDPATRAAPNVPAAPAAASTPKSAEPGGQDMSSDRSRPMEAARQACANLAGDEARQACVRQHAPATSGPMDDPSLRGGSGKPGRGSDTPISPGSGSGGGEAGGSKGGAGFPMGTTPNTGDGKTSGGAGKGS